MKTIVVTGATSGIGYAVCRAFLKEGWTVLGVGRSDATCADAEGRLRAEYPDAELQFFPCDLAKQADILRLGKALLEALDPLCDGRLDVLVNNAGCVRSYYTTTEDGYETVFAVNHLAAFLLTRQLMPALRKAKGRVLVTASGSHKLTRVRWDDVMLRGGYRPLFAYKQSKLCNLLFALGFNRRFAGEGLRCYGIDPGLVNTGIGEKNTSGIVRLVWHIRRNSGVSADEAAKTYVYAATLPGAQALYYGQCKSQRTAPQVNEPNARRLWKLSEQLCGITDAKGGE